MKVKENEEYRLIISQRCLGSFNASKPCGGSTFLPMLVDNDLPTTMDWRDKGYVTSIKDQKDCGSCWAFSPSKSLRVLVDSGADESFMDTTLVSELGIPIQPLSIPMDTGSLEGQHYRKTNKLVSLSEQQLVDCSSEFGNMGCMGGLMDQAFEYIKSLAPGGLDTEDSYAYHAEDKKCHYKPDSLGATCTKYIDMTSGDESALQQAVATVGPVSVAIDAAIDAVFFLDRGVYDEPDCSSDQMDHGVLAVGYGTSDDGQDYWLVKNSWGFDWGDKGYIMMSRNKHNKCGIATASSYPLV
ncbi:cathepsin L1-like [Oncorhynchus kisutch]|uniref:cathepsin L1-like n=1 Tax=Oncorhynchus kisutch TaxID=8019 RepID=UPI0012DEC8BA|nr:cathepsin L1-like [Oncorhynchus kisutch]